MPAVIKDHKHSFHHAFSGLAYAFKNHSNLKIHLSVALIALILGFWLQLRPGDWIFLIFTILLVIVCELINTSLEALGDAVTLEYSEPIKKAKDISAGMVLVSAIGSVIIGCLIFIPYIQHSIF